MKSMKARVLAACDCCGDLDVRHPITGKRERLESRSPKLAANLMARLARREPVEISVTIGETVEECVQAHLNFVGQLAAQLGQRFVPEYSAAKELAQQTGLGYVNLNEGYDQWLLKTLQANLGDIEGKIAEALEAGVMPIIHWDVDEETN
jgi:hypothetical protein